MEFVDTEPTVEVDTAEYTRLLGFPRGHVLEGRALELAEWTRAWYGAHGRPWVYARQVRELAIDVGAIVADGVGLSSGRLCRTFEEAGAHSAVVVAVSAGPELEWQAQQAWLGQRPDEYFFLEMFGSAVVEHLTTMAGARLCAWADDEAMAVLPHDSPGYPGWDIADQTRLLPLLTTRAPLPGARDVLESGMLRPKKSLLAVFGLTRHTDRVSRLTNLVPCDHCSFAGCQFRRLPYGRAAAGALGTGGARAGAPIAPAYGTSLKALARWASERLSLTSNAHGTIDALFRYDGTTCSNMGRRLTFLYRVTLGPREAGYPIQQQSCTPAPDDDGYRAMCEYLREGERLVDTIREEHPLLGHPLDDVIHWTRPRIGPGCYCEPDARQHKWGLVLETIHFALAHQKEPYADDTVTA
jgi:hypothetical protein